MKKILGIFTLVTICTLSCSSVNAEGLGPIISTFSHDNAGMQNPYQELRLLEQNKFRKTEYNEFDDMKTVKEKRNNKLKYEQKLQEPARPTTPQSSDVQLYMENGQLKLKSVQ